MTGDHRARLLGGGLATLWLVCVMAADLIAGREPTVVLAPLFAVAPLIACATLPVLPTAGFAVASLVLVVVSGAYNDVLDTTQHRIRFLETAVIGLAALAIAYVRVRRERQYARVAHVAEVAQRAVLPLVPARVGPVATGARYQSAGETVLSGGDLFDCLHVEGRTCFVVGDVRGKGIGAVEQAARVIRAFRQAAALSDDLPRVAGDMSRYLAPFFAEEEFATALLVQVVDGQRLTMVSCGHPPPLLVEDPSAATLLELPPGLPLGLGDDYEARTAAWSPGHRLLVYTDGLSEARDEHGDFLALESLAAVLSTPGLDDALDGLLATVHGHVAGGRFTDDLAVLLLENVGVDDGPAPVPQGFLKKVDVPHAH